MNLCGGLGPAAGQEEDDRQRDLALAILSFDPNGRPADDALGIWVDAENSVGDLITLWQSMTATVQDALGKFRYKG